MTSIAIKVTGYTWLVGELILGEADILISPNKPKIMTPEAIIKGSGFESIAVVLPLILFLVLWRGCFLVESLGHS